MVTNTYTIKEIFISQIEFDMFELYIIIHNYLLTFTIKHIPSKNKYMHEHVYTYNIYNREREIIKIGMINMLNLMLFIKREN